MAESAGSGGDDNGSGSGRGISRRNPERRHKRRSKVRLPTSGAAGGAAGAAATPGKRRRDETAEKGASQRDGEGDAPETPVSKQPRASLYGRVTGLVGRAVGLLTPGRTFRQNNIKDDHESDRGGCGHDDGAAITAGIDNGGRKRKEKGKAKRAEERSGGQQRNGQQANEKRADNNNDSDDDGDCYFTMSTSPKPRRHSQQQPRVAGEATEGRDDDFADAMDVAAGTGDEDARPAGTAAAGRSPRGGSGGRDSGGSSSCDESTSPLSNNCSGFSPGTRSLHDGLKTRSKRPRGRPTPATTTQARRSTFGNGFLESEMPQRGRELHLGFREAARGAEEELDYSSANQSRDMSSNSNGHHHPLGSGMRREPEESTAALRELQYSRRTSADGGGIGDSNGSDPPSAENSSTQNMAPDFSSTNDKAVTSLVPARHRGRARQQGAFSRQSEDDRRAQGGIEGVLSVEQFTPTETTDLVRTLSCTRELHPSAAVHVTSALRSKLAARARWRALKLDKRARRGRGVLALTAEASSPAGGNGQGYAALGTGAWEGGKPGVRGGGGGSVLLVAPVARRRDAPPGADLVPTAPLQAKAMLPPPPRGGGFGSSSSWSGSAAEESGLHSRRSGGARTPPRGRDPDGLLTPARTPLAGAGQPTGRERWVLPLS